MLADAGPLGAQVAVLLRTDAASQGDTGAFRLATGSAGAGRVGGLKLAVGMTSSRATAATCALRRRADAYSAQRHHANRRPTRCASRPARAAAARPERRRVSPAAYDRSPSTHRRNGPRRARTRPRVHSTRTPSRTRCRQSGPCRCTEAEAHNARVAAGVPVEATVIGWVHVARPGRHRKAGRQQRHASTRRPRRQPRACARLEAAARCAHLRRSNGPSLKPRPHPRRPSHLAQRPPPRRRRRRRQPRHPWRRTGRGS
jgi:hypothetical protein